MEIEKKSVSYLIVYSRGRDIQRTSVVGVSTDNEITSLINNTFKGRFKKPESLTRKDGVRIVVKRINYIENTAKQVKNTIVYNKSVRQVRIEMEKAIINK